jgi:F-type H+-transporting ATPase subunit a
MLLNAMALLQEQVNVGEMVLHHTADACSIDIYPPSIVIPIPGCHIRYPIDMFVGPTKHVVFMLLAAALVFLTLWSAGRSIERRGAGKAPKGFSGAVEGLVLWVRNDIAIANIGHDGAKFAPLVITLFFFILYANLLGLIPHGASPTGNLAVTAALAIMVFLVVEIAGFIKLGPRGYLATIFPHFPGLHGAGAVALSIAMSPIELLGKLVKPFALAVRLFGNMTAGHFVILSLFGIVFLFGNLGIWSYGIGVTTALLVVGIMGLELIVALLQAYVFALLSAVFIGLMQHEH